MRARTHTSRSFGVVLPSRASNGLIALAAPCLFIIALPRSCVTPKALSVLVCVVRPCLSRSLSVARLDVGSSLSSPPDTSVCARLAGESQGWRTSRGCHGNAPCASIAHPPLRRARAAAPSSLLASAFLRTRKRQR